MFFVIIDDFSKLFDETIKKKTLEEADKNAGIESLRCRTVRS
ncbi:hypothetical protein PGJ_00000980 [Porphyromonas gingivalis AJW4]|nr:hypothetical protein PGJ_00000980 [Porphyromonas gingivalis AJW4]